jgi:hypothetical protein
VSIVKFERRTKMSQIFIDADGKDFAVISPGVGREKGKHEVIIDNRAILVETLCGIMLYVLTNTDLCPKDPRTKFRNILRNKMRITSGFNKGAKRYKI